MTKLVSVGKITSLHGVRGWVKVFPLTDNVGRFEELKIVTLSGSGNLPARELSIQELKYQHDRVLVKFSEVGTREDAEQLKNRFLQIPETDVEPIEDDGTYYYYQLEGLEVRDTSGEVLGKLDMVFQTGSNDVYVVKGGGKEYYVPALKKCVQEVDLENGVMIVDREWVT